MNARSAQMNGLKMWRNESAPCAKANRLFHPEDSVIDVAGIKMQAEKKRCQ